MSSLSCEVEPFTMRKIVLIMWFRSRWCDECAAIFWFNWNNTPFAFQPKFTLKNWLWSQSPVRYQFSVLLKASSGETPFEICFSPQNTLAWYACPSSMSFHHKIIQQRKITNGLGDRILYENNHKHGLVISLMVKSIEALNISCVERAVDEYHIERVLLGFLLASASQKRLQHLSVRASNNRRENQRIGRWSIFMYSQLFQFQFAAGGIEKQSCDASIVARWHCENGNNVWLALSQPLG